MIEAAAILIIEDDIDVQRAARVALADVSGRIDVRRAPDATLEALLAGAPYEAVLLDMNFVSGARSGAEGLDALTRIQACDSTLAVVLMTAYGGVQLAVTALKRGATDFVLKPWYNDKLVAVVKAATEVTRHRRAAETRTLDALEKDAIERAVARAGGNLSVAAGVLGISRPALYRRLSKHGLRHDP
jgi:DNA-binding NtrC family response regulator